MNPMLPTDPKLPHLARALDAGAMHAWFDRPGLLAAGWTVQRCAVERVKYRPRRNLAVAYRLALRHGGSGLTIEQFVGTRWCTDGESLARHRKAGAETRAATAAGPAVVHDAALDLVAHWWPHDAKLGAAAAALGDADTLRAAWLPEVARALAASSATLVDAEVHLAQLVPEHRVTARACLRLADGSLHTVYAKGDAERRGPATQAAMQALWDSDERRRGALRVPQPLGWQPGSGLHWQRGVDGRALIEAGAAQAQAASLHVGQLLAALHTAPVTVDRVETAAGQLQRLQQVVTTLQLIEPAWTPALERLAQRLAPRLPELFASPAVTLHGDLHPRNLLLAADGRLSLIDLDSLRRGPPVLDLGAWAADALTRALLAGTSIEDAVLALREVLRGYRRAGGAAISEAEWALATAWQLLSQRAWRCAVNLKPGRYALVRPVLDTALLMLGTGSLNAATHTRKAA
jgi:hypothetical protein